MYRNKSEYFFKSIDAEICEVLEYFKKEPEAEILQYNTITLFKEGSAITCYSFLSYGPQKNR